MRAYGGRHEIKHSINRGDLLQLRSRLSQVMAQDENTDACGGYRVRSLYFDNYRDKALREKIDGVDEREKFRFRFYNDNPSFLRLEKKSKKNGLCFKRGCRVEQSLCRAVLAGDYEALKQSGEPLQVELYSKIISEQLRPKNIVDYRREAFVFGPGNVRITLDQDIRATSSVNAFLEPDLISVPIPDMQILEVKYDHFLPELIRGLALLSSRQATAFSKYAATRFT